MQVSEMYAEAGRLLADPNNERWSQAVLLSRINLAQTKVLALTNAVKTKETLTATASNPEVQLDTDVMDIIRVDIKREGGKWYKLRGYLRDQLDYEFPNWQQEDEGEPMAYWWDGTNQKLNLVPAPDSTNAISSGLRVWEVQKPADLSSSSDAPYASNSAMIPYHMAIVHWVVSQCWMDDGTPEALQKARFHKSGTMSAPGEFESEIMRINAKFDTPEDIPAKILWRPQGGRRGSSTATSKSNPLNI